MNWVNQKNWLPSFSYNNLETNPKFVYLVHQKTPEYAFQYGFEISSNDFDFFNYYFNIYAALNISKNTHLNAYESIHEALINFRKDFIGEQIEIKDLYLYTIRADDNFFNKEITRLSIATGIIDERIAINDKKEIDKIIFAFNQIGQKYSNYGEWFTTKTIGNEQIFSASQIKINFKNTSKSKSLKNVVATPYLINVDFRNPNYQDLETRANKRAFIYPQDNGIAKINLKKNVYYFPNISCNKVINFKAPFTKGFLCDNSLDESILKNEILNHNQSIEKALIYKDSHKIKREIKLNYYSENIDELYKKVLDNKNINYYFKPIRTTLLFNYENNKNKSVFMNVTTNRKKGKVVYEIKKNENKKIIKINFDKKGRIIFDFKNENFIPFGLTVTNIDLVKEYAELDSYPATINNVNQNFHLEHAYDGIFYLKSNNTNLLHLDLAIKHKDNSFVFLNPKKKYDFAYDLVNIDINQYKKNNKNFIFGNDCYCPELIDLNLRWIFNKQEYKPNIYITNKNNKLSVEQARSTIFKTNNYNFLYDINTLKIIYVDINSNFKVNSNSYCMVNNFDGKNKYRWLEWNKNELSNFSNNNQKWIIKKVSYNNSEMYWIISYLNNDYLWVQQKGENWGFFFLAPKNSNPIKSSPIFFLNKPKIK